MIAIFEYRQLRNHESMYLLFAFFAGIFLLIRFVGAGYLRRAKKTPAYLPQMLNRNHLYIKRIAEACPGVKVIVVDTVNGLMLQQTSKTYD